MRLNNLLANAKLPSNVMEKLNEIFEDTRHRDSGETAQYIPDLASVKPELFGIALCDMEVAPE